MIEAIIAAIVGIVFGVGGKFAYDTQSKSSAKTKVERDLARAEQQKMKHLKLRTSDEKN
jgi:hypothetical protein